MRNEGFSLFELLIVMGIVAVLIFLFASTSIRSIRNAQLREVATQVATDLRRARSDAQKGSSSSAVVLPSGTGSSYTAGGLNKTLPYSVSLVCKTGCAGGTTTTISYSAPYGELGATGSVFTVRSPMSGITDLEIRIVGVTGKVIVARAGS